MKIVPPSCGPLLFLIRRGDEHNMPATKKKEPKESKAKAKGAKKPSAYNIFMKDELAKIKKAKPSIEHK